MYSHSYHSQFLMNTKGENKTKTMVYEITTRNSDQKKVMILGYIKYQEAWLTSGYAFFPEKGTLLTQGLMEYLLAFCQELDKKIKG